MALIQDFDGPIPGENFTSDTKNYPWHRPPEYTDLDDAIDFTIKRFTKESNAFGLITMLEMGLDVATITRTYVISGIGAGRWTPDFAILLAGPVARIIMTMAKLYKVDYDLGLDEDLPPTKPFLEAMVPVDKSKAVQAAKGVDSEAIKEEAASQPEAFTTEAPPSGGGFMSRPQPVTEAQSAGGQGPREEVA